MGRGGEQWHVSSRDARAHGLPAGRTCARMGYLARTSNYDQVRAILTIAPGLQPGDAVSRYGINNIRTLVGHKVPIESVEKSPAVRF